MITDIVLGCICGALIAIGRSLSEIAHHLNEKKEAKK